MVKIPRLSRKDINTPFLHVMVQGINKEYIFQNKVFIEKYLNLLKKYNKNYPITIIAYCVMNNHVHLLMHTDKIEELGKYMQKVNLIYSQFYNKANDRCGIVFRNRYKAEPIYDLKHLINCIQYIHMNPIKANMVNKCEEYPFSSYNEYIKNGEITKSKIMTETFGDNYNYKELFDSRQRYLFIDVDKPEDNEIREVMDCAINRFININKIKLEDIISDKMLLVQIIEFLKSEYKFKYKQITTRLQIAGGSMQILK